MHRATLFLMGIIALFAPFAAFASETPNPIDLTTHAVGYAALIIFALAYVLVMTEEFPHLRKLWLNG